MDPIEPIRLDMNLFNMAMMQRQHQAGLEETQRHHGMIEAQASANSDAVAKKVRLDAAEQTIKDPDATPFEHYNAVNSRMKILAPGSPDIPPDDYLNSSPEWHQFALTLDQNNSQSPEVAAAVQALAPKSGYVRRMAAEAMKNKQATEANRGWQQISGMSGAPQVSPEGAVAIQGSPAAQKSFSEAAAPSALEVARMNEITQRTKGLKVQEATATNGYKALNQAVTPVFNIEAEEAHVQNMAKPGIGGPLSNRLSTKDSTDQSALTSGTLTTEERQQAKQAIPEAMKEMNQRARALQQELHNAKNDVTGQAREPEQIQAELSAIRTAVAIKGKEFAYLSNETPANRLAMKQSYESFQKDLDQKKAEVLRLRQASSGVAQGALNEKIVQDEFNRNQRLGLAGAQAHYLEHKDLLATTKLFPGIEPDAIRQIDKDLNKPQVAIDMGEKASVTAAKEFMQSTRTTYDQLKNAPAQLKNLADAKALIPQAKGFMGPGGEGLLEAAKFMNNRLGMSINTEGVKGAEELRSRIFFNVMDNLKKMDAQPSQMQQVIMMDSLGKLGTDPNALTSVLNAYEDSIRNKVAVHNTEVEGAMKQGTKFPYDPRIKLPEAQRGERVAPSSGTIKSEEEWDKLPSGSIYKAPDGKMRKKK